MLKLAFAGLLALALASPAFAMATRPGESSMFAPALTGSLILAALCVIVLAAVVRFGIWAAPRLQLSRLRSVAMLVGALSFAAVPLAGCAPTGNLTNDIATFNTAVANDLPTACALLSTANASFQTIAATGKLSATAVTDETAAMAGVNSICANPSAVSAATALATLANAYAAVVEAGKTN